MDRLAPYTYCSEGSRLQPSNILNQYQLLPSLCYRCRSGASSHCTGCTLEECPTSSWEPRETSAACNMCVDLEGMLLVWGGLEGRTSSLTGPASADQFNHTGTLRSTPGQLVLSLYRTALEESVANQRQGGAE